VLTSKWPIRSSAIAWLKRRGPGFCDLISSFPAVLAALVLCALLGSFSGSARAGTDDFQTFVRETGVCSQSLKDRVVRDPSVKHQPGLFCENMYFASRVPTPGRDDACLFEKLWKTGVVIRDRKFHFLRHLSLPSGGLHVLRNLQMDFSNVQYGKPLMLFYPAKVPDGLTIRDNTWVTGSVPEGIQPAASIGNMLLTSRPMECTVPVS
jgi:hypothetical protein